MNSNIVTSDTNFDVIAEFAKSKTLNNAQIVKRSYKVYIGNDQEIYEVDDLLKSTAIEVVIHVPDVQEFYYKPGILDHIRDKLSRFFLVGLAVFYVAHKIIRFMVLNKMLNYVRVKNH